VEEILKGQVIIRSQAFATFSATEFSRAARKDLAGCMWPAGCMLCRPDLEGLLTELFLSNYDGSIGKLPFTHHMARA